MARSPAGLVCVLMLWATATWVFWGGLDGGFVWDDGALIAANARLDDSHSLGELLTTGFWNISDSKEAIGETYKRVYRPVVTLAFFVQRQLFGNDTRGYHIVSLLLHLYTTTLVFWIVAARISAARWRWAIAFVAALLFAVHPSRAESVAWISGSTELWMGAFVLSGYALWLFSQGWTWLICALFGLALLSKETAVVVPLILFLELAAAPAPRDWRRVGWVAASMMVVLIFRFGMMPPPDGAGLGVGAGRRVVSTFGYFIEGTFWPWRPMVEHGFRYTDCSGALVVPGHVIVAGIGAVLIAAAAAIVYRRDERVVAGLAWALLPLAPVLNLVDLGAHALAPERFLYLPVFGVVLLFTSAAVWSMSRRAAVGLGVLGAAAIFALGCIIATPAHVAHFKDARSLWEYEVSRNPSNMYALELVAKQRAAAGETVKALALFTSGSEFANGNCNPALAARFGLLGAAALGRVVPDTEQEKLVALRRLFDDIESTGVARLALDELSLDAKLAPAVVAQLTKDTRLFTLPQAVLTMRTLDLDRAERLFRKVLKEDPDHAAAHHLLATALARQGKWDEAVQALEEARARLPKRSLDKHAEAIEQARELATSTSVTGRRALIRQAQVQTMLGAPAAARRILQPELDAAPGDPAIVLAYVRVLVADRRFDLVDTVIDGAERAAPDQAERWASIRRAIAKAR